MPSDKLVKAGQMSQLDKFKELARDLESDEDEGRWDDRLRKLAKVKPDPATQKA